MEVPASKFYENYSEESDKDSRQEKIISFRITLTNMQEPKTPKIIKSIAKHPHYRNRSIPVIENLHQAPEFGRHLKQFLNTFIISSRWRGCRFSSGNSSIKITP